MHSLFSVLRSRYTVDTRMFRGETRAEATLADARKLRSVFLAPLRASVGCASDTARERFLTRVDHVLGETRNFDGVAFLIPISGLMMLKIF